jgi:putative FmdB family regulatory protein
MPIFEYICADCSHRFETIVRSSASPECPACGGGRLEKQLSVFAVGAGAAAPRAQPAAGACGACGDPRGPGACSLN